ncbi:MAG: RNA 2',3'-cyclic phosphodiesterase [Candidatus Aenigmarchaeota archaeon]|nr:RNA 2',3'-cyclic phosphodiesterase [Candidatus Aenigmarchaeota archaeon]
MTYQESSSSTKRVFLAIDIPNELKKSISEFQNSIKKDFDAKWVEEANFHFNLKFFGNLTEDEILKIKSKTEEVVKDFKPFYIEIYGMGVFPNFSFPRVVWLGCKNNIELQHLSESLDDSFSSVGIKKEERRFVPHLTLGRLRSGKNKQLLKKIVEKNSNVSFGKFLVKEIILFESKLSPKGPVYKKLYQFALGE